ncbi:MAG: hypothetical protein ACHP8B_00510 [Terriglobales bacterium]
MRKVIILFGLFGLLAAMQLMAQDKSIVTVKSAEVNNGVVILTVYQTATSAAPESFALHCNKGMTGCKLLEPGTYMMVRLPKNWGMYDCANVDLYASTADPASGEKLGQYCLIEK